MYATLGDLNLLFGESEMQSFTDEKKTFCLSAVSAHMDSYLSQVLTLPIDFTDIDQTVVDLFTWCCCALTRCKLYDDAPDEQIKIIKRDCNDALKWLEDVSNGKIKLNGLASKNTTVVLSHYNSRYFTSETL